MNLLKRNWALFFIFLAVVIFFRPTIFEGKLPIPADTIVGLYHPFRDLYAKEYPNGTPFKNFLLTDPVRQQYPWRGLSVDLMKKTQLPLWNPYAMAGYPLLGNLQSASFYPLNLLFFVVPFALTWNIMIFLQPLLAGIFLYLYLRNLRMHPYACLLSALSFAFSGFFIAWLEWGTVLHSALWLPLILLSIDKMADIHIKFKKYFLWLFLFTFALTSSFLAGHLQTFFYVFLTSVVYMIVRWWQYGRKVRQIVLFAICCLLFVAVSAVQWFPTLQLINESARNIDLNWQKDGWFIPWQHLVQFIAPDFFGNPATLNYWGVWNYGEFIGYVGIIPLLMALFALLTRRDKKTLFFATMLLLSLFIALPTPLAKLPYVLNVPFISTAQPTRLLFVSDFSLAILAALGLDFFLRSQKRIWNPIGLIGIILAMLWILVFFGAMATENIPVASRNLRLPTVMFLTSAVVLMLASLNKSKMIQIILLTSLLFITVFDLLRFGWKFTPFTNKEYLFPSTKVIEFLQEQEGQFRIMITDSRIFPPNFGTVYRLQSVDGYDPLYLRRYGELIAASERRKPDISPPFGFNRIITPHNYDSKIIDILGVKYILSLTDLSSPKLTKVFQEGQTRIYENVNVLPRAFFVEEVIVVNDRQKTMEELFKSDFEALRRAVVELDSPLLALDENKWIANSAGLHWSVGNAEIKSYSENTITIETKNDNDGFLVLTDTFYPTWKATIDGDTTTIYRTDYNFRGIIISKGIHSIVLRNKLF